MKYSHNNWYNKQGQTKKGGQMATFVNPMRQIGRMAAQMCLDMIDGKEVEDVVCEAKFHQGSTVASIS